MLHAGTCTHDHHHPPSVATSLDAKIARFAPVDIAASIDALPPGEAAALQHIVKAAEVMDQLFLEQVWEGNPALLQKISQDTTPEGRARRHYFMLNKGPWSRLDHNEGFLPAEFSVPPKPPQANYYPADATKEEVDKWIASLKGDAHAQATSFFTVIRRAPDGRLTAVPYNVAYQGKVKQAADHLRQAAELTTQPTLKKYLQLRADAFLSNDYFASDMAWMELDASIEPTIGPYETYEDEWFGYKAAFEAFVTLRDDEETKKLAKFGVGASGPRERAAHRPEGPQCRSSAPSRQSASSMWCSRPATATAVFRRRRSICPTTTASSRKRAPSA